MSTNQAFPPPTPDEIATASPVAATPDVRSGSRRGLTFGLAAGLLGGTAVGLVFGVPGLTNAASGSATITAVAEQTTEPTTDPTTDPTTEPTTDPAPAEDPVASVDRTARLRERLQPLVDDGTITAEQADAVAAQLVASGPQPGDFREPGEGRGPGGGFGGHGRGLFGRGAGVVSEVVTDLLDLDADEVRTQLRDGQTLAEIATAQGVEPQAVIDELVGEVKVRLDAAVDNGRIDQATADEKLADAETRITDMVNNGAMPRHEHQDTPDTPDATESED